MTNAYDLSGGIGGNYTSVRHDNDENNTDRRKYRIAYMVSHPIQYQAPLLRMIAAQPDMDLVVFFQSDFSVRNYVDKGFGRAIEWDVPLLDGYRHEFLPAWRHGGTPRPWNYGMPSRLWKGEFDVLWVHGCAKPYNLVAMAAARMASIPVLVRDEMNSICRVRSPFKNWIKQNLFFRALRTLCSGFLAIGTLNKQYYLDNGVNADDISLVPYCVDNEQFAKLAKKAAQRREKFRADLGLSADRPVILYASKFERRKHPDDLLAAYLKVVAQKGGPDRPYLLFVGDGDLRADLEARAAGLQEDVKFLGFRNQTELPAFFDLCDVFVLPSELEPWGLVVNEAMSVGRPVIVSDHVGCAPDLVKNGVNGYVFPLGDVEALAGALGRVLSSRETAAAMGRASAAVMAGWSFRRDIDGLRSALARIGGPRNALAEEVHGSG